MARFPLRKLFKFGHWSFPWQTDWSTVSLVAQDVSNTILIKLMSVYENQTIISGFIAVSEVRRILVTLHVVPRFMLIVVDGTACLGLSKPGVAGIY